MKINPFLSTISLVTVVLLAAFDAFRPTSAEYIWPVEDGPHEATWLQWPHDFGWDPNHVRRYEPIWLQMTKALAPGEDVRIIAYDRFEKRRINRLLRQNGVDMSKITIYPYKTDDVWIRDNGPIFVFDENGELRVEDWGFNGWGKKADYWFDDFIPKDVAWELYENEIEVPMINEGGSIEVDGSGTLMAKRSSILNDNRNPGLSQAQAEAIFSRYLGATNFIWLDGTPGLDITDDHIDGTARFASDDTIVTLNREDFLRPTDYDILANAKNSRGDPYKMVHLPLTAQKVPRVGDFGLYTNYYVGNEVVIFPIYNDDNDQVAADIIKALYPEREMALIDFTELYVDGGIAHCVTMQQAKRI